MGSILDLNWYSNLLVSLTLYLGVLELCVEHLFIKLRYNIFDNIKDVIDSGSEEWNRERINAEVIQVERLIEVIYHENEETFK